MSNPESTNTDKQEVLRANDQQEATHGLEAQHQLNTINRYIDVNIQEVTDMGLPNIAENPLYQAWQKLDQIVKTEGVQAGTSQSDLLERITSQLAQDSEMNPRAKELAEAFTGHFADTDVMERVIQEDQEYRGEQAQASSGQKVEKARDGVEKEALIQEVEELARGSVGVVTYVHDETAKQWQAGMQGQGRKALESRMGGWTNQGEKYRFDEGPLPGVGEQGYQSEAYRAKKDIQEYVVFMPHQKVITEQVERQREVKKSFGRTGSETYETTVATGLAQESYHDVTGQGPQEPAVRVEYHFDGNQQWSGDGTRPGRKLVVGFSLPESVASTLQTELQFDPKMIRGVAEKVLLDYGYPQEVWDNGESWGGKHVPAKPPYELTPPDHSIRLFEVQADLDDQGRTSLHERDIATVAA